MAEQEPTKAQRESLAELESGGWNVRTRGMDGTSLCFYVTIPGAFSGRYGYILPRGKVVWND